MTTPWRAPRLAVTCALMALETSPLTKRRLARALLPLGLLFLAVGISTALVDPFLSLFLSTEVDAGPASRSPRSWSCRRSPAWSARLADRAALRPAADPPPAADRGVAGRDRRHRPDRRSSAITGCCSAWRSPRRRWPARSSRNPSRTPARSSSATIRREPRWASARLRTVFSLAWVAGPPLAAFLLDRRQFRLGLRRRRDHVRAGRPGRDLLAGRRPAPRSLSRSEPKKRRAGPTPPAGCCGSARPRSPCCRRR